jgi:hypothetical protein
MSIDFKLIFSFYIVISSDGRLDNLNIQTDHEPLHVVKPADQNVHYKQQVNVRFLQPPPGPEPAPIIIKERHAPAQPPPPPVVIRQRPATPPTPPPLIIRKIFLLFFFKGLFLIFY